MSSESRLFVLSPETKDELRQFRMGTSRSDDMQAHIYKIDKQTLELKRAERDERDASGRSKPYTNLQDLGDDLPDNAPRFVLLSYPITLTSGRAKVPYVMLYYMPVTTNNELRMLYAGAKELLRNTAEVNTVVEIASEEDLDMLKEKLGGE